MNYKTIRANTNMISIGNTGLRSGNPFIVHADFLNAICEWRKEVSLPWDNRIGGGQENFLNYIEKNNIWKNEIKLDNHIEATKDIRLKTSFLSDIGLVTENKELTEPGKKINQLMKSPSKYCEWQIYEVDYEWFKQIFKYDPRKEPRYKNFEVCPLRSLIYCCLEFKNNLPYQFLKVFWSTASTKEQLDKYISIYNNNNWTSAQSNVFKALILRRQNLPQLNNARDNIELFSSTHQISDNTDFESFVKKRFLVGHGKGGDYLGRTYDLILNFLEYWENKKIWKNSKKKDFILKCILKKQKAIKTNLKPADFNSFLFENEILLKNSKDWDKYINAFEKTDIVSSKSKKELLLNFHIFYSVLTDLVNINEYEDINFRHLKLAGIFDINYDSVRLKIQFKYLFERVKDKLLTDHNLPKDKTEYRKFLESDHNNLSNIFDFLDIKYEDVYRDIVRDFPEVEEMGLINYAEKKKLKRFEDLVEKKFDINKVIELLKLIDNNEKNEINKIIKQDFNDDYVGTIPALFEYFLGIAFYLISDKSVNLNDILEMGLDENLLPKSHTTGGRADISGIKTSKSHFVIEATLSDSDNQRQLEAEPVPRHIARYIEKNNHQTIGLFVARDLDPNNLIVLRNYKFSPWYDPNSKEVITKSMNILPLTIKNIIFILENGFDLVSLETLFYELISSDERDGYVWYEKEINRKFI